LINDLIGISGGSLKAANDTGVSPYISPSFSGINLETIMTTSPAPHPETLKTPTPKSKLKAKAYQSVNPSDGKTLKTFEKLTDAQLETAIAST